MNRQNNMLQRAWSILGYGAGGKRLAAAILLVAFALSSVLPAWAESGTKTFNYPNPINIKDNDASTSNPNAVTVSGVPFGGGFEITGIRVKLNRLYHYFPKDIDMLLQAPSGKALIVMSDVGGGTPGVPLESPVTITFKDGGSSGLLSGRPVDGTTYAPSDFTPGDDIDKFQAAVPPPYVGTFAAFYGNNPNGEWKLLIYDDQAADSGALLNGWTLEIDYTDQQPQAPKFEVVQVNPDGPINEQPSANAEPTAIESGNKTQDGKAATVTLSDPDTSDPAKITVTGTPKDTDLFTFSHASRRTDSWIWDVYVDVNAERPLTEPSKKGKLEITATDTTSGKSTTQTVEVEIRGVNDRPYFQVDNSGVAGNITTSPLPATMAFPESDAPALRDLATFFVNDVETAKESLLVLLNSDNKDLIDPANAVITGPFPVGTNPGGWVKVQIKATANKYGKANLRVTVVDTALQPFPLPQGISRESAACEVTVGDVGRAPTITFLDPTPFAINEDSSNNPFRIKNADIDDPASGLVNYVRYENPDEPNKIFGNQTGNTLAGVVIPADNKYERTLLFTPLPNKNGTVYLRVGVYDGTSPTPLGEYKILQVNVVGQPDTITVDFAADTLGPLPEDTFNTDLTKPTGKIRFTVTDPDYPNRTPNDNHPMYDSIAGPPPQQGWYWSSSDNTIVNGLDQSNGIWTKEKEGDKWYDVFNVRPVQDAVGSAVITIYVIDPLRGSSYQGRDSFTVTYTAVNDAPRISFSPTGSTPVWGTPNAKYETSSIEGSDIDSTTTPNTLVLVRVLDPENPAESTMRIASLTPEIIPNDKEHLNIDGEQKLEITTKDKTEFTLTIIPKDNNVNGKAIIEITAIDKSGAEQKNTIELTIIPRNDNPMILGVSNVETTDGIAVAKEVELKEVVGGKDNVDPAGGKETSAASIGFTATISSSDAATYFIDPSTTLPIAINGGKRVIFFQLKTAGVTDPLGVVVPVTLTATDGGTIPGTGIATATLNLVIYPYNAPPIVAWDPTTLTTGEDVPKLATFYVQDIDNPRTDLTVGVVSGNQTLVPNGRITFNYVGDGTGAWAGWHQYSAYISPAPEQSGTAIITAQVKDPRNKAVTANMTLTVTPDEEAPLITNKPDLGNISIAEDSTKELTAALFDSEASIGFGGVTYDNIKVEITSSEVKRTIDSKEVKYKLTINKVSSEVVGGVLNWKFSVTPPANYWSAQMASDPPSGDFTVTIKVSDPGSLSDTHSFQVNVTVVNDKPVIAKDTDFGNKLSEGSASDKPIKGVITMDEDGAAFETLFNFSDVETPVGKFRNWRNADPDDGDRNYNTDKPNITIISLDESLIPTSKASLKGKDKGRTLHIESAPNKSGKAVIGIQFTDGGDLTRENLSDPVQPNNAASVQNTYWLEVVVNPINDPPTMSPIPPIVINEDRNPTTGQEKIYVTLDDQETLDYNLLDLTVEPLNPALFERTIWENDPGKQGLIDAGVGFIAWGGVNNWRSLEFYPKRNASGKSEVKVTVTDEQKASFTQTFLVTVNAQNDAPYFIGLPPNDPAKALVFTEDQANKAPDFIKQTFSVEDVDNPYTDLTVAGTSGDTTVIPSANILLTLADDPNVSGENRANLFTTIIPNQGLGGNAWGLVQINMTVTDKDGKTGTGSFYVDIKPDNDPPTIAGLPSVLNIPQNGAGTTMFTLWDEYRETAPQNLIMVATSSNPALIPNGNIVIGRTTVGQRQDGTIVITPIQGQTGEAIITVAVTDDGTPMGKNNGPDAAQRKSTSVDIRVVVGDVPNTPPTISSIADQKTKMNQFVQVPFSVNDKESGADPLTIFGQSSNPDLIPNGSIFLSGIGSSRSAYIVPAPNKTGSSTITITVADPQGATSQSIFNVNVSDPATQLGSDFNNDGKPDLLFQRNDGTIAVWYIDGANVKGGDFFNPSNPGPGWNLVSSADFTGNGAPDLFFQHTDGSVAIWDMNGTTLVAPGFLTPANAGADWKAVAVADINGDSKVDIVYQHADGSIATWMMNGTTALEYRYVNPMAPSDPNFRVVGMGDLNGDKKADLVFQNTATAEMAVWFMDGLNMTTGALFNPGAPSDPTFKASAVADYNGDGKADVVLYNGTALAVWFMDGANLKSGAFMSTAPGESGWSVVGP